MREENGRKYLYSLIPTPITFRTGFLIILYLGILIFGLINPYKVRLGYEALKLYVIIIAFLTFLTTLQIYINKGYRASFDDDAIYLRPNGVGWNMQYKDDLVMRYNEIGDMFACHGNLNLKPFEFIEFQRVGWDGEEQFSLSRIFLRENQLKELLRFAHTKIPDKFPQDVIDYMNAEPGWIERKQMLADD